MILGHGHPEMLEAVVEQASKGMIFFATNALGAKLAEEIVRAVPRADQVRFLSSGGEADMYAMRLARAATGRDKILKFEDGNHGMLAEAQMSLPPTRLVNFPRVAPDSAGIPAAVAGELLAAPFNDSYFLESLLAERSDQIAGVIVEPLQRIVPPVPGFLQTVRALCDRHGIMLIFDEVVPGFRFAYDGAQEAYGVTSDVATLGKVIGGGFPLPAVAGRKALMDHFDRAAVGPDRWLMMLGTLSGDPVAAAMGLKTMKALQREGTDEQLTGLGERLQAIFAKHLGGRSAPGRRPSHPVRHRLHRARRAQLPRCAGRRCGAERPVQHGPARRRSPVIASQGLPMSRAHRGRPSPDGGSRGAGGGGPVSPRSLKPGARERSV